MNFFKKFLTVILIIFLVTFVPAGLLMFYFNLPVPLPDKEYELGITFSNRYAENLELDWRETYIAILSELDVKKLRIPVYWDQVEKERDVYDFSDVDWQLEKAQEYGAEVILVLGQRVPRWPECFIPGWISSDEEHKKELLEIVKITAQRYKGNPTVKTWQVENEPFLAFFGECPALDVDTFDEEIKSVKAIDDTRPILLTDSGELSFWHQAVKRAYIFGTTMYRTIHREYIGYYDYPVGPNFFKAKKWFIEKFSGQNNAIVVELQAEPWASGWVANVSLEEQFESMNEDKLVEFVEYARKGDFSEVYLWGAEWWYWLKIKKTYPAVWDTAKDLFEEAD